VPESTSFGKLFFVVAAERHETFLAHLLHCYWKEGKDYGVIRSFVPTMTLAGLGVCVSLLYEMFFVNMRLAFA
jgi:hypothetical protein